MDYIREQTREIPVAGSADVIVVGGGVAGVAAAVAAARNGAKVILIEKSIILGGLATLGHVCVYLPIDDGGGHKVYGGLPEELLHVMIRYSYDNLPEAWRSCPETADPAAGRYRTNFNIPAAVVALDELMEREGVQVVFDTCFCAPVMEGDRCSAILVENKSGRSAYTAKMFVDATGDSDLLFRAGAPCETQESIVSTWTHEIDLDDPLTQKALEERSVMKALPLRWLGLRPDADNSNSVIPKYLGTTSEGVNGYIATSRRLVRDYLKKNRRPGYAHMTLPLMPQFRTTRHLVGIKELELDPGVSVESSIGCMIPSLAAPAAVFEFPYEGLIDAKITNVLAAGRMVSARGEAWEIARFIPACVMTGQAAGTAAAMAAAGGVALQKLDVAALQKRLAEAGVKIHMDDAVRGNTARGMQNKRPKVRYDDTVRTDSLSYPDPDQSAH